MSTTFKKILLVGHCGADSRSLTALAQQAMGLEAERINDEKTLLQQISPDTLLWINRAIEGRFAAEDGLGLIQQLASQKPLPAMMLITNYPDVQAQAKSAGAMDGFGKSDIRKPALSKRLGELATQDA